MKTEQTIFSKIAPLFLLSILLLATSAARAGLTFTLDIYRTAHGAYYFFYTPLSTNSAGAALPFGSYVVNSPQWPASGSTRTYTMDANGLNVTGGSETGYTDFDTAMSQITNGTWNLIFTNATTSNFYTFMVSAPGMTSNMLPATIITYPTNGALNVPNQPDFTWQGPTNWFVTTTNTYINNYDYSFYEYPASFPATQTNWADPGPFSNGLNLTFALDYVTNYTPPLFMASTPQDTHSNAFSGWVSTDALETGDSVSFAILNPVPANPVLIAHYTFDNGGNIGQDTSGHGYDLTYMGGDGVTLNNNAKAGSGAAYFDGNAFLSYTSTPGAVLTAFSGDFSLSFWVNTTQTYGSDGEPAYLGAGIVAADIPGAAYDLIPAALDGGEIGFNTGSPDEQTLDSATDINDGHYHHVVVTRRQSTGEKQIYIDGALSGSPQYASMNPLSDPHLLAIGCGIDASQYNPANANTFQFFHGLLDDIQIYAGVLAPADVANLYNNPGVTAADNGGVLVARYDFEDTNNAGQDSSGNGNDANCTSGNGGTNLDTYNTNAAVGAYARQFFGDTSICFYPGSSTFTAVSNALSGSFSVTAWVKTTATVNQDFANAYFGNPVLWVYSSNTNAVMPLTITGSKAAFTIFDPSNTSTTLHSATSVNDGIYHFLAATRNAGTGLMSLYVDGNLEATNTDTTDPIILTSTIYMAGSYYTNFDGLLDDVRIYASELSPSDVENLNFGHSGVDFNPALNTTNFSWVTSGNTDWFVETTNTQDGGSAARSGSVTNDQFSSLSMTVMGPGTLTFYWSTIAFDPNFGFTLEFYMDDTNNGVLDAVGGDTGWYQDGPFNIPAGQHTLGWAAYAYGDTDPTEAGFLDQVAYIPDSPPVITANPFSQTNYSGYPVWLSASVTGNPPPTWQWYEVGSGAIAGATTNYFLPTNAGVASVAGSYYAIASNSTGTATTLTAAVTFVSAPLPPGWAVAVKSPFAAEYGTNLIADYYAGCAVDSAGNVYAADQYLGDVNVVSNSTTINTLTAPGLRGGAALVKSDPSGHVIWAVGLTNNDPNSFSYANCVALAPGNGVYLSSVLIGTNWLGTNGYTNNGGDSILLSRFDANGSNLWSKFLGPSNLIFTSYNDLVADASGNVTLAGVSTGTIDFGGTNLTAPSGFGGFIAQYDSNGVMLWAQVLPGNPQNMAESGGNIYVSFSSVESGGVTNISIGNLSNLTDRAYGLAALNASNGQALWQRGVGEQFDARTAGFADDIPLISVSGSDVFLTGTAYGTNAVFGGFSVPIAGGRSQYFARYDTNGNAQTATNFGNAMTMPWASAANATGMYISGDFDNYSYFGNDLIAAPEYYTNDLGPLYFSQPFVAKFDRNGHALWALNGVSSYEANFRGIATAPDGVWASGFNKISQGNYPAQFGTNSVYSDGYLYNYGTGVIFFFTQGGLLAKIAEAPVASPLPVTLVGPQIVGPNFQFQFQSQAGFTNNILYRTNLATGTWLTNSTVAGDGTVKTISVPLSVFSPSKAGFVRVSTE